MQESDAIHLLCYMVLENSGASVLHGTNKFWNYRDSMTLETENIDEVKKTLPNTGQKLSTIFTFQRSKNLLRYSGGLRFEQL